jgi:tetratricopeptide (TPR) repeat protein
VGLMSIMPTAAQEEGNGPGSHTKDSIVIRSVSQMSHAGREDSSLVSGKPRNTDGVIGQNVMSRAPKIIVPESLLGALRDHYVTIMQAIDATYSGDYGLADSVLDEMSQRLPAHPVGPLMRAATVMAQMRDYEVLNRVEEFQAFLDTAYIRAEQWIATNPDDSWGYCYLGHTYGYRAMWQGHFGSWMSAVKWGLKAKGAYRDAIDQDSLCWDAYLGLGSYHYWKSAKTEFINWTGFLVKDQKKLGQAETEKALAHGIFSKEAAAAGLLQIYLHKKQYAQAIDLAKRWQAVHPRGKTFMWGQAYAEFSAGQYDSALVRFDSLHDRVVADSMQGMYNLMEIDYHRALCYDGLGLATQACAIMERVPGYEATDEVLDRQKDKLKKARKYIKNHCRN